jgi:GTPase
VQVRTVRRVLAEMPALEPTLETGALNRQEKDARAVDTARLGEYTIEAALEERVWVVRGVALERFAAMTNWDYFEAVLRFQRVLKACGLWRTLERCGARDGDTVVLGDTEFRWAAEQREGQLYQLWAEDLAARGRVSKGSARWPHAAG